MNDSDDVFQQRNIAKINKYILSGTFGLGGYVANIELGWMASGGHLNECDSSVSQGVC